MLPVKLSFDAWLKSTQERRDALSKAAMDGSLGQVLDKTISALHEAQAFRDDAKDLFVQARAKAMWSARKEHPELTSRERELVEKDAVRDVQSILDACETTVSSLTRRYFSSGK